MAATDALHPGLFGSGPIHGPPKPLRGPAPNVTPHGPAAEHLEADDRRPVQLPMFMRAQDLAGSLTATSDSSFDDPEAVMDRKLAASRGPISKGIHGAGVFDSVKAKGVLNPVQMIHAEHGNLMMGQGHHRVAAAAEVARQSEEKGAPRDMWVPVVHTDAREGSDNPVNIYSDMGPKLTAIRDYTNYSRETNAISADLAWSVKRERANARKPAKPGVPSSGNSISKLLRPMGNL